MAILIKTVRCKANSSNVDFSEGKYYEVLEDEQGTYIVSNEGEPVPCRVAHGITLASDAVFVGIDFNGNPL